MALAVALLAIQYFYALLCRQHTLQSQEVMDRNQQQRAKAQPSPTH